MVDGCIFSLPAILQAATGDDHSVHAVVEGAFQNSGEILGVFLGAVVFALVHRVRQVCSNI